MGLGVCTHLALLLTGSACAASKALEKLQSTIASSSLAKLAYPEAQEAVGRSWGI